MEVKDLITVIITVFNRQFNIDRQLKFWKDSGIKVIIVDSSKESIPIDLSAHPNVSYEHFQEGTFYQILFSVIDSINTPYVIQINDDDFVIPDNLLNGVSFLEKNKDYISYQGSFMKFNEKAVQTNYIYCCRGIGNFHKLGISQDTIEKRMELMQRSFVSPNHAIFRRENLRAAYDLVRKQKKIQSIKYFDWIIGFVCSTSGKFYLSKELFHIRSEERLITDMSSAEYPAYLQREKRLTDLLADDEALRILSNYSTQIELKGAPSNIPIDLIKKNLKLYLKLFHSGGTLYRLGWKIGCIPFLIYNQFQINFRFKKEVKRTLDLVAEQKRS